MLLALGWLRLFLGGRRGSLFYDDELSSYLLQAWQALPGERMIAFLVPLSCELVFLLIVHLRIIQG